MNRSSLAEHLILTGAALVLSHVSDDSGEQADSEVHIEGAHQLAGEVAGRISNTLVKRELVGAAMGIVARASSQNGE